MAGSSKASADRDASRASLLTALERRLGHRFRDRRLLDEALTHASRKGGEGGFDNERLEFLGDRVLGLVIAEALLHHYPDAHEGELAPRLNALVRKETLAALAEELGLPDAIAMAKGEQLKGSRAKETVLGDACEAVIAAIYCDGGFETARDFVLKVLGPRIEALIKVPQDAKTMLQEWAQGRSLPTPRYDVVMRDGPDHAPRFRVRVSVEGFAPEEAEGSTKRAASQEAALALLVREKLT